jgi:hypothetical protein
MSPTLKFNQNRLAEAQALVWHWQRGRYTVAGSPVEAIETFALFA